MTPRRLSLVLLAAILFGIAAWYFKKEKGLPRAAIATSQPSAPIAPASTAAGNSKPKSENPAAAVDANPLAVELNASASTIRRDLAVLNEIFANWQTNFPRVGNPVGENVEITAALTGDNSLHFAFIPKNHPAINATGELCDRWGTPFRFHQLSGVQMEIRSAGPDKKFGTADDAEFSPVSPIPVVR